MPGTLEEINIIKNIFKDKNEVTVLNGNNATKSNFINQISNTSFKIVHLATHSFYIKFDASKNPFVKIPTSILPQREFRSSILFSDGGEFEKYESAERLESFLNKNLLLGEIIYLPMNKTRLVVLSSCETNIGFPKVYDDIFENISLNTAFKYAGAQYVLGSRWEVSDQYSKKFYSYFYNTLNETDDIEFSYSSAVSSLIHINADPFIWGAFVLIK